MKKIIVNLFKVTKGSKLKRFPYAGYIMLSLSLLPLFCLLTVILIGGLEHSLSGNIQEIQYIIRNNFSKPFLIIFFISGFLTLYATLNIIAKRTHDTGLPAWIGIVLFFVTLPATIQYIIILGIIPTNFFQKKQNQKE